MNKSINEYMGKLKSWLIDCNDYEDEYAKCVRFPKRGEPITGESDLEPYDSLYFRFLMFEITLDEEIRRRAERTWLEIVEFTENIDMESEVERTAYEIYVDQVARVKSQIRDKEWVNYSAVLEDFFLEIEREKKSKMNGNNKSFRVV